MQRIFVISIIVLISLFLASCSDGSNPVTSPLNTGETSETSIPATGLDSINSSSEFDFKNVFGAWQVVVDPDTLTAEILPSRNAKAIGNIFDSDLSQFLNVSPCSNCMRITQVALDTWGDLNLTLAIRHPFANAAARPDLHGFDVRAIFVLPSNTTFSSIPVTKPDGTLVNASYNNGLLNADGLTAHYDEVVSDSRYFIGGSDVAGTLNPFLRFFESYGTGDFDFAAPTGHNVMPTGADEYYRTAVIDKDILGSGLSFYIVADVAYGQSAVLANRFTPQYYLPAFNRTEPWRVEYWMEGEALWPYSATSTVDLYFQIFDWQQGAEVDSSYPNPANLDGIPESSDIDQIILSMPGIMTDPIVETDPISGSGTPTDPMTYHIQLTNDEHRAWHRLYGLLAVRDELNGNQSPSARMPVPDSPAGFPYATLDIRDYSMYYEIIVPVYADSNVNTYEIWTQDYKLLIPYDNLYIPAESSDFNTSIQADYVFDPGHKKFQYRWDYDYDGVTFDIDGAGIPSPDIHLPDPGYRDIGLRIRTNTVPPQETIYTIPVCTEGQVFNRTYNPSAGNEYRSGYSGGKPMHALDDIFYFAFSRETSEIRNIYLMIGDSDGNASVMQITSTTDACMDPSIYIMPSGDDEGIYLTWTQYNSTNSYIYSSFCNLDGTGFSYSNNRRVSTAGDVDEEKPCIVWDAGNLLIYYHQWNGVSRRIFRASSSDYGLTWGSNAAFADNGSINQRNPSAANSLNNVYVVWEEWMDLTYTNSDLHLGISSSGYTASSIINMSSYQDTRIERNPCLDGSIGVFTVVYSARGTSSTDNTLCLKLFDSDGATQLNYPIAEATEHEIFLSAAVEMVYGNKILCAYDLYNDTNDTVYFTLDEINFQSLPTRTTIEHLIDNQNAGVISSWTYANLSPAIATTYADSNTRMSYIGWTQFSDGVSYSPVIPAALGHLDIAMYTTTYED